jgi:hypothetical protein
MDQTVHQDQHGDRRSIEPAPADIQEWCQTQ